MADLQQRVTCMVNGREKAVRGIAWLLAALAIGLFALRIVLPAMQSNTFAFSVYYTSARLALQGHADTRICDEWFYEQQRSLGFGNRADAFCGFGPPTMALVMTPIAWLPPNIARVVWIILDLGMIAAICALAWHICKIKGWLTPRAAALFIPASLILIVLFQPIRAEIGAVQMHLFLALLYALWLYGYVTQRDWLCGIALAGLALVKFAGWPLWIFMFFRRRWHALAWAVGLTLIMILITLPLFTLEFWLLDSQKMLALSSRPQSSVPAYQTILSLLRQTFLYDSQWSPRPVLDAPWLVTLLLPVIAIGLIAVTLLAGRKDIELFTAMATLCLIVPLQPAGEQYHYALVFVVILTLISSLEQWRGHVKTVVILGIVVALFALPPYFLRTADFSGLPFALLAYPRLYGALILWGLLMFKSRPFRTARRSDIGSAREPM